MMRHSLPLYVLLSIVAVFSLGMLKERSLRKATAYVVFDRQIVAVDTETLCVVGRLDTTKYFSRVHFATLLEAQRHLCVVGDSYQQWAIVSVDLPDLRIDRTRRLSCLPVSFLDLQPVRRYDRGAAGMMLLSFASSAGATPEGYQIEYLDPRTLLGTSTARLDGSPKTPSGAQVVSSCMTPDGDRLLLLTSDGASERAYLSAYAIPSLRLLGTSPSLSDSDESPVDVFIE